MYKTYGNYKGDDVPFFYVMEVKKRAIEIIEEYLPSDHFIVSVDFGPSNGRNKLEIILDGDEGVSIEVCALISRKVGYFLEEDELIPEEYHLQVSSPGADSPFTNIRQYQKNAGRDVKVVLNDGTETKGVLDDIIGEEKIEILELLKAADKGRKAKYAKEAVEIEISSIQKINVILTF